MKNKVTTKGAFGNRRKRNGIRLRTVKYGQPFWR